MRDAVVPGGSRFPHLASRLPTALPRGSLGSPGDRQTSRCRRGSATLLQPRRNRAGVSHTLPARTWQCAFRRPTRGLSKFNIADIERIEVIRLMVRVTNGPERSMD